MNENYSEEEIKKLIELDEYRDDWGNSKVANIVMIRHRLTAIAMLLYNQQNKRKKK